jgi:glycopeptide antibiotics resistance protein
VLTSLATQWHAFITCSSKGIANQQVLTVECVSLVLPLCSTANIHDAMLRTCTSMAGSAFCYLTIVRIPSTEDQKIAIDGVMMDCVCANSH